jgi:hypothetical protein
MPNGTLTLTQEYQTVQGTLTVNGATHTVATGRMNGEEITFVANGLSYKGTVKGNRIDGMVTTPSGSTTWTATRQ